MSGRSGPAKSSCAPQQGWPERVDRRALAIFIVFMLVGTPLTSAALFSKHVDLDTVEVEPGSYHAMHFGIYGLGSLRYSISGTSGTETYLLTLDRANFERFEAGRGYESSGYDAVGTGGSGNTWMMGLVWELFLVIVNDGTGVATVEFEADAVPYAGAPAGTMMLCLAAAVDYALMRRWGALRGITADRPLPAGGLSARRKAVVTIATLVGVMMVVTLISRWIMPIDPSFVLNNILYRLWFGTITSIGILFSLRFRLFTAEGGPEAVLSDLAYKLRSSAYIVTQKPGELHVRVSSTSAVKVFAKPVGGATAVSYRIDATPSGWAILIVLLSVYIAAPLGLAIGLFTLYRCAVFAGDRLLPRLLQPPAPRRASGNEDTRSLLIEGLAEGRRLSAEAYEAARSNYQDVVVLIVVVCMIMASSLVILGASTGLGSADEVFGTGLLLFSATALSIASGVVSMRVLARRSKPRIEELRVWTGRLEAALRREIASEPPPDGEPSSFELIVEWYAELPKWLLTRHKAGMFRDPGDWMVIFCLSALASLGVFVGVVGLTQAETFSGTAAIGLSVALYALAWFTYTRWKRRQRREDKATVRDVAGRLDALRAEMESYLGGV